MPRSESRSPAGRAGKAMLAACQPRSARSLIPNVPAGPAGGQARRESIRAALLRVGALGVELVADEAELLGRGLRASSARRRRPGRPSRSSRGPPRASRPDGASRGASRRRRRSGRCRGPSRRPIGPRPSQPCSRRIRSLSRRRRGCPGTSGSRCVSTKLRVLWRMITKTWRALIAISHAPPRAGQARRRMRRSRR